MEEQKDVKRTVSYFPIELHEKLKEVAKEHDRSVSSMIVRLVGLSLGYVKPEIETIADRAIAEGRSQIDVEMLR